MAEHINEVLGILYWVIGITGGLILFIVTIISYIGKRQIGRIDLLEKEMKDLKEFVHTEIDSVKKNYITQFKVVNDSIADLKLEIQKTFSKLELGIIKRLDSAATSISRIEVNCANQVCKIKE